MADYPRGKVRADDDGQAPLTIFVKDQTLFIDFGKPVAWLGFGLADLDTLISLLQVRRAEMAKGIS